MDPQRLKNAYQRLQLLDERLTYRIRPHGGGMSRPSPDQLEAKMRHLAEYTVELKEILNEVVMAFASRSQPESDPAGTPGTP